VGRAVFVAAHRRERLSEWKAALLPSPGFAGEAIGVRVFAAAAPPLRAFLPPSLHGRGGEGEASGGGIAAGAGGPDNSVSESRNGVAAFARGRAVIGVIVKKLPHSGQLSTFADASEIST
jgi:hypothetical protein